MSLLQEARTGIQRQKAEAEERRRQHEEDHRRHVEEEKTRPERENAIRIEEEKRENLQSQLRLECAQLLRQHGTPPLRSSLDKVKAFLNNDQRQLKTTIGESGEELVEVVIKSEYLAPEKGKMTVQIQGIGTFLQLPKTGYGYLWTLGRSMSGKSASSEELTQYQDVLKLVKAKLEPSLQAAAPRHPGLS